MGKRKKVPKVRDFVKSCIEKGILSPSEMRDIYNKDYPIKDKKGQLKPKTSDAFRKAMRRLGISAQRRLELKYQAQKSRELKDIEEYEEVQNYLDQSKYSSTPIGKDQIRETIRCLRQLWDWMSEMGYPNPREWDQKKLGKCMEKYVGKTANGQWKNKNILLRYWGAFNRCFQGKLPKGWSMGLKREAGELKDFLEYEEAITFFDALRDTRDMSLEGWRTLFSAQINTGCREGTKGNTGIVSLSWENIDFKARRCKIRDKGKKGKPARWWTQVPLELFPWLKGWEKLMKWWEKCGRPNQGRVFPINYSKYLYVFHQTRRRAGGRIAEDLETMVPHIMRKTHAQWGRRIGITLDNLCGDTTESPAIGRYGVGWDVSDVPRKYYLTKEEWEYEEQDKIIEQRLSKLVSETSLRVETVSPVIIS